MVYKCCVPNCNSNYRNGPKVPVYRFPKENDLMKKWLSAIPRENFQPSKHSRVCQLHFEEEDVNDTSERIDEQTGKIYSFKRQNKVLRKGAIPSKFPNCPSYLSKSMMQREDPDEKRKKLEINQLQEAIKASIVSAKTYEETHSFSNFEELECIIKSTMLPKDWNFLIHNETIIIFNLCKEQCPQIEKSILIDKSCLSSAYLRGMKLVSLENYMFPFQLSNVNDIIRRINLFENFSKNKNFVNDTLSTMYQELSSLTELIDESKKYTLSCILEQLKLFQMKKNSYRYSSDFLILSTLLYTISPHSYRFLRSSAFLIFPHPNTLKSLCSKLNVDPKNDLNIKYIRDKYVYLQENDKKIVLLLDEIHLKPYLDFKGGNIMEVGNKLRIQNILPLKLNSNKFGKILINSDLLNSEDVPLDLSLPKDHIVFLLKKFNFSLDDEDILLIVDVENVLAYIAGYCIHSCINRIKYNICKDNLTLPKEISPVSCNLIENLDRGGLKFPKSAVIDVITISYLVTFVRKIRS